RRELDQSSRENGLRLQPGSARDEGVVVCEHRAGVEGIVEIDSDHRTRAPEMQDFRSAEVELVDAISILLAGRKDVDRDVGRVAGRGAPQNLSDDLAWNSVVRRKERPGLALQDAAELYVDFRNDVGRERPYLRQPAVVDVAIRIRRTDGRGRETGESLRKVDGGAEAELRQVVSRLAVVRGGLARAGA